MKKFEIVDITASLKNERFPGCAPAPLDCTPQGEEFYGKERVIYLPKQDSCSPDNSCSPDFSSCGPLAW